MKLAYLDNNATTPVAPEVFEAMLPFLKDQFFNPSSMYPAAKIVGDAVTRARKEVAALLGEVPPVEILFTGSATEANNQAISGAAAANPGRRHIITSAVEHPAVFEVCKNLARQGVEVTFLAVDREGRLNINEYVRALRQDTLLVSLMHANNETGVIFPIEDLSRIAKETDPAILFHTDATQAVGKIPLNLRHEFQNVDLLSFSGHKLHAPKGIGVLYLKRGTPCKPLLIGGHQENGLRAGTLNVPYIIGLAKACELARNALPAEAGVRQLRDHLESALEKKIPYLEFNGRAAARLPNTTNLAVHFIEGESILFQLAEAGICASTGSACSSGSLEPSHVLRAMKVPFTAMHGSVRFSLSRYTTRAEVDHAIEVFPQVVASLRRISPYWDEKNDRPREGVAEKV